jgi:translation initiation factor 3 subunit G
MRWGDADEDDDVLPATTVVGPNDKGMITKTEYFRNEKNNAIKKTTRIHLGKVQTKVYEVRSMISLP